MGPYINKGFGASGLKFGFVRLHGFGAKDLTVPRPPGGSRK